jgi:hypothetical protein
MRYRLSVEAIPNRLCFEDGANCCPLLAKHDVEQFFNFGRRLWIQQPQALERLGIETKLGFSASPLRRQGPSPTIDKVLLRLARNGSVDEEGKAVVLEQRQHLMFVPAARKVLAIKSTAVPNPIEQG